LQCYTARHSCPDNDCDHSFSTLPLSPAQLANLDALEYTVMTPIQAESLPHLLAGSDVIAQAKTGSGKTAAFGIALLNKLNQRLFATQALVLCPRVNLPIRSQKNCVDWRVLLTI
jgi:superfamily II DNA/RNA helicase